MLFPGYILSIHYLHQDLLKIEAEEAYKDILRARESVNEAANIIDTIVLDWAYWDDTYDFVQSGNPDYLASNLTPDIAEALKLELLLFIGKDGRIIQSMASGPGDERKARLYSAIADRLVKDGLGVSRGILSLEDGTFLFAARPILTSREEGPARGLLVMGEYLDAGKMRQLSISTGLELDLLPFTSLGEERIRENSDILLRGESVLDRIHDSLMYGYIVLEDVSGDPACLLKVSFPRISYQNGIHTLTVFGILLVCTSVLFLLVALWLLKYIVITRLKKLEREVRNVCDDRGVSTRVSVDSSDEITTVSEAMNCLLDSQAATLSSLKQAREEAEMALSHRAEMERHIIQSEKMQALGTLVGGMAHTLNNYLMPIITLSRMVHDDLPESSDAKKDLERVVVSSENAVNIVRSALSFARQDKREILHCNVVDVLTQLLPLIDTLIPADIVLETDFSATTGQVPVSTSDLQTVVMNLLNNSIAAIQSAGGEGHITIKHRELGKVVTIPGSEPVPCARITVSDTGPGIEDSLRNRIFDPFFTTKDVGQGTGLGLSVSHGIVTRAGGALWFEDIAPHGTAFHIDLPLDGLVVESNGAA